jgi:prevent-host-death family protein
MAILAAMAEYSIAEAKNNLPKLVDRAVAGEEVTITRRGKRIAKIVAEPPPVAECVDRPKAFNDIEWIRRHQVKTADPNFDGAAMIRAMRDEGF